MRAVAQQGTQLIALGSRDRSSRHEHRVRSFSADYALLTELRSLATDRVGATLLADHICSLNEVPPPTVTFHGRRGPHTGYCLAPAWHVRLTVGERTVQRWEQQKGRTWPDEGMIRLGNQPSLGTVAHELGHHLVNQKEPPGAAPHGKVWVTWFDVAAAGVVDWCNRMDLDLGGLPRFSTA